MRVRHVLVRFAAVVAVLLAVAPVRAVEPESGNVNGVAEDPLIARLIECIEIELDAEEIVYGLPGRRPPSDADAAAVREGMLDGAACLGDVIDDLKALRDQPGRQPNTRLENAIQFARKAQFRDVEAADMAARGATSERIRSRMHQAYTWKERACTALQGIVESDPAALRADRGLRSRLTLTQAAFICTFTSALHPATLWLVERRLAQLWSLRHPPKARKTGSGGNRYLGFRATTKATAANKAHGFAMLRRDLRGPYELRVTIGSFTSSKARRAALGTAFGCVEFDVKDSDPLVFLSVCARPTGTGVQVFASSPDGPQGDTFIDGAQSVVLKTTYDGTTFTCFAKPTGSADTAFVQFATWTRAQGADVWRAGFGAAQLTGAAEIGIDDVAIYAIAR